MKVLHGDVWTRRGMNLLWDGKALSALAEPQSVVSIRQFFAMIGNWPADLPCNEGKALVVAGLEGCLDIMKPGDAERWLDQHLGPAIDAFGRKYELGAALVFWMPTGKNRFRMNAASEAYSWLCSAPHGHERIEIGRILWAGAEADVRRIIDPKCANSDADGPAWIGLNLTRLS
ncbi:hypothetical protein [Acidicapsa acidisoli]|uniref:hypothetical protein n=1 Tax=Acidicapsa acidisoli TaxID=1615681 RepID=UPI0021E08D28|nr:hypothetical protein [Acidicapsa acidisoli]